MVPSHQDGEELHRLRVSKAKEDISISKVAPVLGFIVLASVKDTKTSVILFYLLDLELL
jgi:hypothetical protein